MSARSMEPLVHELERVAREAGTIALSGFRRGAAITKKGDIDLVTEYDLASESHIVAELSRTTPELVIVGEEGKGASRASETDLVCYVDPIDGTTNFAHGHPFFAVSLGVCRAGVPLAGVIYAPALDVCWRGIVGQGATRNGEPCYVSERRTLKDSLCATGFGYDVVGTDEDNVAEFGAVQARARGVRRCGAAALDLALVADGTYDAYWEYLLKPWDLAAGAALVRAAGGRATSFVDDTLDVRRGTVVATNGLVHDELIHVIDTTRGGRPVPSR